MDSFDWFMRSRQQAKAGCTHRYVQAKMARMTDATLVVRGWTCAGCGEAVPAPTGPTNTQKAGTTAAGVPSPPTAPPEPSVAYLAEAHARGYNPFDLAMLQVWQISPD